jgi:hypothetical protein
MKNLKKVLCASLFIMLAVTASAQIDFGVKAGFNASGFSGKNIDLDYKAGYSIGLMAQASVPIIGVGVESGLYYSTLGAQKGDLSSSPAYLQLPVLLTYKVGLGSLLNIYPSAGLYFGYGIGGKSKVGDIKADFFQDGVSKFDTGLSVGINLQVTKIVVGLGYDYGLKKLSDDNDAPRNSNIKVSVGYLF